MRTRSILLLLFAIGVINNGLAQSGQEPESLGLPGDNLNLYAVLKIFQESETLESFEQKLNDKDSMINNLDLDENGEVDYIRVIDNVDGNVHNIVLQTSLSATENQDIAVITVQKKDNGADIQVIGDEDLYGPDYIIEPNYDGSVGTPNPGYSGKPSGTTTVVIQQTDPSQVLAWPVIRFIFMPSYVGWVSPWHWHYYPSYWRPWGPHYWHYYYGYHYHWNYYYFGYYRRWPYLPRYPGWNNYYYSGIRTRSPMYYQRRERGDYRRTYAKPDMLNKGSAQFVKMYPKAPTAHVKVPPAKVPEKPVTARPAQPKPVPGAKPGEPSTRPAPGEVITRPTPKPKPTPTPTPLPSGPSIRPISPEPTLQPRPVPKPLPKPVQPRTGTTRPAPAPKPSDPGASTKPANPTPATKPVTKPAPKPAPKPAAKPVPVQQQPAKR